jgi:hypothetical protein
LIGKRSNLTLANKLKPKKRLMEKEKKKKKVMYPDLEMEKFWSYVKDDRREDMAEFLKNRRMYGNPIINYLKRMICAKFFGEDGDAYSVSTVLKMPYGNVSRYEGEYKKDGKEVKDEIKVP